ncbi:MAG: citrate/2-methylcitrate synthase [Anaerovoracaceae bacterium]|jgi:citrate synthase
MMNINTLGAHYSEISPKIEDLSKLCIESSTIPNDLFIKHKVNRGLRDLEGNGVLTGLTEISEIQSFMKKDGEKIPCEGKLYYRGYDVEELVQGFIDENRYGFEETVYLLLFGQLPTWKQLLDFQALLAEYQTLPVGFVREIIMQSPSSDMMNALARSVLTMYAYDTKANDISIPNVLRQCILLIALFPALSVYGYQTYKHFYDGESLHIHTPRPDLSTAENILHMLRPDSLYTELEARILDLALILHAEHGGGNNSTFTTHVISSSGTDTYSVIAASLGSLKGPKHGGANIKVVQMFKDMKNTLKDWTDEEEVSSYLRALLRKEVFDKAGLIYGMGHAVYSLSDPRANVFKQFVKSLSEEKGRTEEFKLYSLVERLAPQVIEDERKIYKGVSANIDFYSGFVYSMLDLPLELYTPIFAIARIGGWSAHRIEELINAGKIIRPAYMSVCERREYKVIDQR